MSRKNKFHNLIEREGREEKRRAWEKLQKKDTLLQKTVIPQRTDECREEGARRGVFSRKFLSWAGAAVFALIIAAIGVTQILPKMHEKTPQGGGAGVAGSEQESESVIPETSVPETGDEDAQAPSSPGKIYAAGEYDRTVTNERLQASGYLYLDGYSQASIVSAVYTDKQTGDEIAREEKYTSATETEILLRVCGVEITFEEWFVPAALENATEIDGVTVRYGLSTEDGQKTGYAFLRYGGNCYYLYIYEHAQGAGLSLEDVLEVAQTLLMKR